MIYVGIDVAKDKHDCFITNSDGEVLFKSFSILNNREGFDTLFQKVQSVSDDLTKVKVGLEATGHYSYNLLGFLLDKGLTLSLIHIYLQDFPYGPVGHTLRQTNSMNRNASVTRQADSPFFWKDLLFPVNVQRHSYLYHAL